MTELNSNSKLILAELREKCRNLELESFDTEAIFKYKCRELWWEFCQKTQSEPHVTLFRDFWGSEETYPRTIA
jgi:hypothetical protein